MPTFENVIAGHGDLVLTGLRPSILMRHDPAAKGRSCLGGSRMLARPGEIWPSHAWRPMALLAQIDFEEVEEPIEGLPARGVLQAFLTSSEWPTMGEPDVVNGAARLRILPSDEPLVWIESIVERVGYGVRFETIQTINDIGFEALSFEENQALKEAFPAEGHRVLGFPDTIQYDPFEYPEEYDPRGNRVLALQIDSDSDLGWHWVDSGLLHFLADRDAFAAGVIEDAIFDMQFH